MGKKKKPFIDKKKSQTFRLVPRSQQDPLAEDSEHAQYVLKSVEEGKPPGEHPRVVEQQQYGIYYDDEYNYLQHLREPGSAVLEPAATSGQPQLPGELFGSEIPIDNTLDKVLPARGPQPDWDPDVIAALEEAEMGPHESGGDLADDFILMASSDQPGEHSGEDKAPWWKNRVDFAVDKSDSEECEVESSNGSKGRSVRFTEYSLSSSVVPRSEGLTHLDERFEEFMAEYEDHELGAVEEDSDEELGQDHLLLESALRNFETHFKQEPETLPDKPDHVSRVTMAMSESEDEELVMIELPREEKWDCESILSTYSNIYNHPTKIVEPSSGAKREHIKLSNKSQLPLGVIPGPVPKEKHPKQVPVTRARGEDKEDKKMRKKAMKEERKQRRVDKKATKMAFKNESLRIEKQLAGMLQTAAVI